MELRIAFLCLLATCLILAAVPTVADTVYTNGPINGTVDGWTINFGFAVSDTFTVGAGGATLSGLQFGAWLFPGDTITSTEVQVTSNEFGGTTYFDQVVNLTQSDCTLNQYGYNVCTESGTFNGPNMAAGNYWLTLLNAEVPNGDPVYWDDNSGPSQASENSLGTLTSEAFTLLGRNGGGGTTPEPSSIVLFGTGALGLASILRRKLL